ncbi:hypothetical protein Vi05172_g12537 [Venturia inaequalis]|nr:hypothetical protein Vi05172_g12537 [Venturia inaequalis]
MKAFQSDPIAIVGASVAAALCLRLLYHLYIAPLFSPIRHLPKPNQGSVWLRLIHEPRVPEMEEWVDKVPHNGLIRYFGLFNRERILIASPEAAKDLLATSTYKFIKPELQHILAYNVTGHGLLIQEGTEHKEARKNMSPAFSPAQMKKTFPVLWKTTVHMLNRFPYENGPSAPSDPVSGPKRDGVTSLTRLVSAASIDMIGQFGSNVSFQALDNFQRPKGTKRTKGTSSNASDDPKKRFGRAFIELFKMTKRGQLTLRAASIIGTNIALHLPLPAVNTINSIMGVVRGTAEQIVSKRVSSVHDSKHDESVKEPNDMLQQLINSGHFSQQDMVEQTIHFFAAATETGVATILWTIHLLSRHLDWQTRLRDEIRSSIEFPDELAADPAPELRLRNLKCLKAVCEEILRFHSVNTLLWRECIEPATIVGTPIPKGSQVVYSPWVMGRDPKLWGPDAREFKPERWLDVSKENSRHPYSFLAFGGGSRRCIGEQYGRDQLLCFVAGLVGRFEFRPIAHHEGTDDGTEVGDNFALTLFKVYEDWNIRYRQIPGW